MERKNPKTDIQGLTNSPDIHGQRTRDGYTIAQEVQRSRIDENAKKHLRNAVLFATLSVGAIAGEHFAQEGSKDYVVKKTTNQVSQAITRNELQSAMNLPTDTTFYKEETVVTSGRTYQEAQDNQKIHPFVNGRNFPGTIYNKGWPGFPAGEDTEVIAQIPMGTPLTNVLEVEGNNPNRLGEIGVWGAVRRGDIQGPVYDQNGKEVQVEPNQILYIDNNYLTNPYKHTK